MQTTIPTPRDLDQYRPDTFRQANIQHPRYILTIWMPDDPVFAAHTAQGAGNWGLPWRMLSSTAIVNVSRTAGIPPIEAFVHW